MVLRLRVGVGSGVARGLLQARRPRAWLHPLVLAEMQAASTAPVRIDAHVHLWAPKELADEGRYPYAGQLLGSSSGDEPPMPGHAELLLEAMTSAGVRGALVVQPGNHLYDHRYLDDALAAHPGKLAGCLLADPTPGGGGVAALEDLVGRGYRAVRFNPYLWPEGGSMADAVGRAVYARAGELGVPVGHMPFKGLLRHIDDIEALALDYPATRVILDHVAFCKASGDAGGEEWARMLALARFPQVYVKLSAFFRISTAPPPYADAAAAVRRVVDAYGAQRCMWGTDWPWVTEQCGYASAWTLLDEWEAAGGSPVLTREEREWVEGRTAQALFPGAWA